MLFLGEKHLREINEGVLMDTGVMLPSNVRDEGRLNSILDSCENNEMFGQKLYPTVRHVAAFLLEKLVIAHVFSDGNKRTAFAATDIFLRLNGLQFKDRIFPIVRDNGTTAPTQTSSNAMKVLEHFILELAQPETYALTYDEVLRFVQHNTEPVA